MKTRMNMMTLVTIAAVVIFIAAANAAAGDPPQVNIVGEYGFSGGGNCIVTPISNWDTSKNAIINPAIASGLSFTSYGTLTFERKGKGNINFTNLYSPNPPAWSPTATAASFPFTYEVNDDVITVDALPNSFIQTQTYPSPAAPLYVDHNSLTGYVTADHKVIVLATTGVDVADTVCVDDKCATPILKIICLNHLVCNRLD
jgi:hypothetical protein